MDCSLAVDRKELKGSRNSRYLQEDSAAGFASGDVLGMTGLALEHEY